MAQYQSQFRILFLIVVLISLFVGLTIANYRYAEQFPGGNDFLARWMGARYWLVYGVSPYESEVSEASQKAIYGRLAKPVDGEDVAHFVYPLNSMIFFGLFGLLEYVPARAIWMTLLEFSLIGLAFISLRMTGWNIPLIKKGLIVLFTVLWYHGARTILLGQFAGINALLIVISIYLILEHHDYGAGLMISLTTAKPQMVFLLIPFILIWAFSKRRWELWWGVLTGLFVQFALTLILLPQWPRQFMYQLLDYPKYTDTGSPLSIIASQMPGIYTPVNIFLNGIFLIYLLVEWFVVLRKGDHYFLWTAMMTLVISNLVAYRTATTNNIVLIPVMFYIFRIAEERWHIIGKVFVYFALLAFGIGLWILFFKSVSGNIENPIMYLPFPLFCLAGLWWIRWWATRAPRLPIESFRTPISK